jgi:hypothetical protein
MAIVLDRAQRDAVYGFVVSDLAEAGDLALVLAADEIKRAQWLRRNFEQATQLLDQIGCAPRGAMKPGGQRGPPPVTAMTGRSWGQPGA